MKVEMEEFLPRTNPSENGSLKIHHLTSGKREELSNVFRKDLQS